ncbi:MAG: YetF domain-containing protein [Janthinobacterium lividum]
MPPPHITDYLRILMGGVPWSFLLEASIRLVLLYLLLLTGLRLMGKRMAGQLSRTELAALVSLAAAIGIPILSADRGLLAPIIIASVVVLLQRLVVHQAARHPRVEQALQGNLTTVVADGVLQLPRMEEAVLSQERLFAQLRGESLEHLGQVRRLYMEANGTFSLVEEDQPKPGLSLIPGWDKDFRQVQPAAPGQFACCKCGQVAPAAQAPTTACPSCGQHNWEPAVMVVK